MHIITDWLSIGKWRETCDTALLRDYQVGAMLQLADSAPHPTIPTLYLPIDDGLPIPLPYLQEGIGFICHHYTAKRHILIACGVGISRSVAFGMVALKECLNISLCQAYCVILKQHNLAAPHPALVQSLCDFYAQDPSFAELWQHILDCNNTHL